MYSYPIHRNYDLDPQVTVSGYDQAVSVGWDRLLGVLTAEIEGGAQKICMETYPGADVGMLSEKLRGIKGVRVFDAVCARKSQEALKKQFEKNITDDRVFGYMCHLGLEECFDAEKLEALKTEIAGTDGPCIVIGTGAALAMPEPDRLWYWDMTRWEIQLRYREGEGTWMAGVLDGRQLTKYKVGFFIEWRMADKLKKKLFGRADHWVDANVRDCPRMIDSEAFHEALRQTVRKPFRMQAYFDASVWGGQWMKTVFGLDPSAENYGWSFDGVPEENSLKFRFGEEWIHFPAMDLVLTQARPLLGEHVYGRFGTEFPIRFDFLDTMEGGNLSLQVHPLTQYIQETFGMNYTQDESYYILDATDESCVYLGVREDAKPEAFRAALERAQAGLELFPAEDFVNKIPVKKHDHVLIPAGTTHCSGKNTVVLEISATPYIFTFKLWDWGRIGLDGLPRPVHIDHGMANIQFDRNTEWVKANLLHQNRILDQDETGIAEHTGLHNLEFIETVRYTVNGKRLVKCMDSVTVANLVEGAEATFESPNGAFEPVTIHYGETFIIPEAAGDFIISSNEEVMLLTAYVR